MRNIGAATALLLLAACGGGEETGIASGDGGAQLEAAAAAAGLLPDPEAGLVSARFEQRSELGIDRLCLLATGADDIRVGLVANFGSDSRCVARGSAERHDGGLRLALGGERKCEIDADFDGTEVRLPGVVPDECAALCTGRASLAGVHFYAVEQGDPAARSAVDPAGRRLCS